jgi:hypothetical protein
LAVIRIEAVKLPEIGGAESCPPLPERVLRGRLDETVARMENAALDVLVVYSDREHSANLAYLTGFDPRFEEAVLLLDRRGNRLLLVGNECLGFLPEADLGLRVELWQALSLPGQPRDKSRPLAKILSEFGVGRGRRVGCVGWKCYQNRLLVDEPAAAGGQPGPAESTTAMDLPAYLVDLLRELAGDNSAVVNATNMFMSVDDGMRLVNEPEQIAQFEFAATVTSEAVLQLLRGIRVGAAEQELEHLLDSRGLPLTCHRMISFGDKAKRGLASPSARRAALGDPLTTAFGVVGALTCRAGCVASGPKDLPAALAEFYPRLAANYFGVTAAWYSAVRVGARGGEVFQAAESRRDPALYNFAVNPGHYLHLEEWVNSPFAADSRTLLKSGMVMQMDIIPVSRGPFCYSNAEDGIALADEALRGQLAQQYPEMWARIQRRRKFMQETLGIALDDSVLPLGNTTGWLPPYALSLDRAFVEHPA